MWNEILAGIFDMQKSEPGTTAAQTYTQNGIAAQRKKRRLSGVRPWSWPDNFLQNLQEQMV